MGGATCVLNALAYLSRMHPGVTRLATKLSCFRKNRHRMRYEEWKVQALMLSSGLIEAACKTLVAQRLKLSGTRWSATGAQAIPRSGAGTRATASTRPGPSSRQPTSAKSTCSRTSSTSPGKYRRPLGRRGSALRQNEAYTGLHLKLR